MSLFSTTSIVALLIGVVQTVTLNSEDFTGSTATWSWNTPGADDPGAAFTQTTGTTPSGSTGPNGGANAITRGVEPNNSYAFTEASGVDGPFTLESPEFNASGGTLTLSFDVHMRFGAEGAITDGTLQVQGWNGSAWSNIGAAIIGSQQLTATAPYLTSAGFDIYNSAGFSNTDFKFRFLFTKGVLDPSGFLANYDCAVDNCRITGPGLAQPTPPPTGTARAIALLLGNRTIFVAPDGNNANSGLVESLPKRTIQNALSTANRGDVVLIENGDYFESFSLTNSGATVAEPILIAARNAGQVRVLNLIEGALDGTANWIDRGGGVFGLAGAGRSFLGYEVANENFIPGYRSASDITASSIDTTRGPNSQDASTNKPDYGMSVSGANANGELRLRLKGGANPNGRQLALTDGFSQVQFSLTNSPNTIIDGIIFDGAGDTFAVSMDLGSTNCVLTNCKFFTCQFGVKPGNNCLIDNCEYSQIGVTQFRRDINDEPGNGDSSTAVFRWAKNHYVGDLIGGPESNSLVEGGIDGGNFGAAAADGTVINECWIHDAFEGSKIGRSKNGRVRRCRIEDIMDDAVEAEVAGIGPNAPGQGTVEIHDNRMTNVQVAVSVQDSVIQGNTRIYRNVIEVTDQAVTRMPFAFKTVRTPNSTALQIYQNTLKHISANDQTTEGFGSHTILFPFVASGVNGGARVTVFQNNAVIYEDLDLGSGNPNSGSVDTNVLADDDESFWRSNGGSFEGAEASLLLDVNFVPAGGSPLANAGSPLPGGLPDSRGENTTVGAHEVGAVIDVNWPRPNSEFFRDTTPPRWTEPGAL